MGIRIIEVLLYPGKKFHHVSKKGKKDKLYNSIIQYLEKEGLY